MRWRGREQEELDREGERESERYRKVEGKRKKAREEHRGASENYRISSTHVLLWFEKTKSRLKR